MNGGSWEDDPDGFGVPRQVLSLLDRFGKPWWVAGGWAVDLCNGARPEAELHELAARGLGRAI